MDSSVPNEIVCAQCQASNFAAMGRCWICGAELALPTTPEIIAQVVSPAPREPPAIAVQAAKTGLTFGLDSLFLTVTLISVCLGAAAFGIVLAVAASSGIAFSLTCWARFFGGEALAHSGPEDIGADLFFGGITGLILGLIAGGYVAILLLRALWPLGLRPRQSGTSGPGQTSN